MFYVDIYRHQGECECKGFVDFKEAILVYEAARLDTTIEILSLMGDKIEGAIYGGDDPDLIALVREVEVFEVSSPECDGYPIH